MSFGLLALGKFGFTWINLVLASVNLSLVEVDMAGSMWYWVEVTSFHQSYVYKKQTAALNGLCQDGLCKI